MKLVVAVIAVIATLLGVTHFANSALPNACSTGHMRGFAHVRGDARVGIGSLPPVLTSQQNQFEHRYNCSRVPVQARRINEGVYEVRFPDNPARVAAVTAVNSQGASASAYYAGDNRFVVTIRGPIVENDILQPREVAFYVIVF